MFFSIVIPTYNSRSMLERSLNSINKIDYPDFETIIVDDGSTDDTAAMVKMFDNVKYVKQTNQGPAAARNKGVEEAQGELILFTDSDCVLPPDILSDYTKHFSDNKYAGMGGGYQTLNKDSKVARYIGFEIEFRRENAKKMETRAFGTYNSMFRKKALLDIGGFDTSFKTASGEDFDLCYRLADKGYKLGFDPDIVVFHEHPNSIAKYLKQQFKRGETRTKNIFKHKKKAISDNYVEKNVEWQPVIAAGIILGILLLPLHTPAAIICFCLFGALLIITNYNLLEHITRKDPALLPLSILLAFLKPITWSIGSIKFIISKKN